MPFLRAAVLAQASATSIRCSLISASAVSSSSLRSLVLRARAVISGVSDRPTWVSSGWWKHRPAIDDPPTGIDGDRTEQLQHEFALGRAQEREVVGLHIRIVRQAGELR